MMRRLTAGTVLFAACSVADREPTRASKAWAPVVREGYAVTPDSVRLFYRVVGDGAETVLIGAANYHLTSMDSLATPSRKLVLFDTRGRGKSDSVPPDKMGIEQFDVRDLDLLRQVVGAPHVSIIAWSGMANAAFRYAATSPDRVKNLLLLTPVGPRWVPWWDDMRKNAATKADTAANRALDARVKAGEFKQNDMALCRESAKLGLHTNWVVQATIAMAPDVCDSPNEVPSRYMDYVPRLLAKLGKYDYRSEFGRVKARRLVIHGEFDNPPLGGSEEWVAGQPESRLLVIKGVGHWPHYEKPAETLAAMRAFLDGGWPSESHAISAKPSRRRLERRVPSS